MKNNLVSAIICLVLGALFIGCSTQNVMSSAQTTTLLQSGEFVFMAERANPSGDMNAVLASLPNGGSSRLLTLDYGYTLRIKKEEIKAELPYFGRMYAANMDPSKNAFRFTSKDFTISATTGKKNTSIYTIVTKDQPTQIRFNLEVFPNGKAYLNADSNDRQPISYDGYVTQVSATTK